ncbi:hypothetical protein ACO2Q7_08350 [Rathayibacter sp. KR2-224]|uniref:hypothetical protein n=1 Tax=Rathayibacter sp. KR2-224 TaxID=3400913 RepID=UPI003C08CC60
MVVLITSEADVDERLKAMEVTVWLVDEGWTVATTEASPLANAVRKAAEAMAGTYRTLADPDHVELCASQLPPHASRSDLIAAVAGSAFNRAGGHHGDN